MPDGVLDTFVVDSHPVDDRIVLRKPEQSRLRIARLGLRSQRADFDEREPEPRQLIVTLSIFVQTGGQSDRRRKIDAEHISGQ